MSEEEGRHQPLDFRGPTLLLADVIPF
jgi:hypothetical protein